MKNTTKTILLGALIAAMILPSSGMNYANAESIDNTPKISQQLIDLINEGEEVRLQIEEKKSEIKQTSNHSEKRVLRDEIRNLQSIFDGYVSIVNEMGIPTNEQFEANPDEWIQKRVEYTGFDDAMRLAMADTRCACIEDDGGINNKLAVSAAYAITFLWTSPLTTHLENVQVLRAGELGTTSIDVDSRWGLAGPIDNLNPVLIVSPMRGPTQAVFDSTLIEYLNLESDVATTIYPPVSHNHYFQGIETIELVQGTVNQVQNGAVFSFTVYVDSLLDG